MAEHRSHHFLPLNIESRDPGFPRQFFVWAQEAQSEMGETVAVTRRMIADSQALMADVDRLLVRR